MGQPNCCNKAANLFIDNPWYNFIGHSMCCGKPVDQEQLSLNDQPLSPRYAKNNILWGLAGACGGLSLVILGLSLRKPCGRIPSAVICTLGGAATLVPIGLNIIPGVAVKVAIHRENLKQTNF